MRYTTRIIVPPKVKRSSLPGGYGSKPKPQPLGVRKTFGFGDPLGAAADIQIAVATAHPDFAPVFAQQSVGEVSATGRTMQEALTTAVRGVDRAHFRAPWGADADRLNTPPEIELAATAGFSYFTFDLGGWIDRTADHAPPVDIAAAIDRLIADGDLPPDWAEPYLNRTIDLPGNHRLQLTLGPLQRAAVKYGRAIPHCARMAETAARANQGRPYELEVMFDQAGGATTTLEHLFVGLELESRGVRVVSMGLQFGPGYEPAADFTGDLTAFAERLREHAAVAEFCGPHKISFHEASDKGSLYPIIGRCCGDAFHLKTSGLAYLEGLRLIARVEPDFFGVVAHYARAKFAEAGLDAGISTTLEAVRALPEPHLAGAESSYLDERAGRQMLHVTASAVIGSGVDEEGRPLRARIVELLERHVDIYRELLVERLEEIFRLLTAG